MMLHFFKRYEPPSTKVIFVYFRFVSSLNELFVSLLFNKIISIISTEKVIYERLIEFESYINLKNMIKGFTKIQLIQLRAMITKFHVVSDLSKSFNSSKKPEA